MFETWNWYGTVRTLLHGTNSQRLDLGCNFFCQGRTTRGSVSLYPQVHTASHFAAVASDPSSLHLEWDPPVLQGTLSKLQKPEIKGLFICTSTPLRSLLLHVFRGSQNVRLSSIESNAPFHRVYAKAAVECVDRWWTLAHREEWLIQCR